MNKKLIKHDKRILGHYGGGDYYVTPPQGLRNNHLLHRGPNNRMSLITKFLTIGDYVTLNCQNYGGVPDWFSEEVKLKMTD